jgi:serine/threonine-protein kinase
VLAASATGNTPPADGLIGRTLGNRYRITSLLGQGGMSRVYQAVQAPLQRAVALKVLEDDPAEPMLQQRFLLEASATSQLTHPNTITVFDYGADQGLLYFAMELLRGCNLSQALRRDGPFSEARALHVLRQACRGLREAHARGLVHRDLKPSNLFLVDNADEADFVKVLDFGVVKMSGVDDVSAQLTGGGVVVGTPHYMAPEQARGLPCDARSDIYSLGVVLFQMLTGKVPFEGKSSVDVLVEHVKRPAPRVGDLCPGAAVSAQLQAVVARCLAKKPEDRFADMDQLLAALPGDRVTGKRPPPPPLDFEIDDAGSVPLTGSSLTGEIDERRDTPRMSAGESGGRAVAGKPQVVQVPIEERPRPRRKGAIAGLLLALAATGAGIALRGRTEAKGTPAAMAHVAAAPPIAATPPPAPVEAAPAAAPAPASMPAATDAPRAVASPPAEALTAPAEVAPPPPEPAKPARKRAPSSAPHARAAPASPEVVESLRERLARALSGIRQCAMLDSRRGHRTATGDVTLTVTVEPSGRVSSLGIAGAGLGAGLAACMRGAVERVRFDPFEGQPVVLRREVSLSPR